MSSTHNTPFVLIIRDGWGQNPNPEHDPFNAIKLAKTPVADRLMAEYPNALIGTSGKNVGLPDGTMGNSEVGHQNIGAGRVVAQEAVRITTACRTGALAENSPLVGAITRARDNTNAVHLLSICSDAGVHGMLEHLYAIMKLCAANDMARVFLHLFTDGRDTGPFTGKSYIEQVEDQCTGIGVGQIGSVIGRYWAMDRDFRWERVARAYACLTGIGARGHQLPVAASAREAIQLAYDNPASENMRGDEFVTPTMIGKNPHEADQARVKSGDTVIFCNYRGDRPREICAGFLEDEFHGSESTKPSPDTGERGFDRGDKLDLDFVIMTPYSERLSTQAKVAFVRPAKMKDITGEFCSRVGLRQFRCAETEKFPHVTFFFNDYRDDPFPGEVREIIQSPSVPTYDLQPEMSGLGVRDAVLRRLDAEDCEDVIVVNFANADMVGHTGNLDAVIKACEVVDGAVGQIVDAALARRGCCIVTADHGNAEQMWSPENDSAHTAHTTYDVPLIVVGKPFKGRTLRAGGRLGDILPTALEMIGVEKPGDMTGASLLT